MVDADDQTRAHKEAEVEDEEAGGLPLHGQGRDQPGDEGLPQGQGGPEVRGQGDEELPDRKRFDEGSDLAAVEGQHQEHKAVIDENSGHVALLAPLRGWTTGAGLE
jgi:hypothetical protein